MKFADLYMLMLCAGWTASCDGQDDGRSGEADVFDGSAQTDAPDETIRSCAAGVADGACLPVTPRGRTEEECAGPVAGTAWFEPGGVCLPQLDDWACPDGWVVRAADAVADNEPIDGVRLPSTCEPVPSDSCAEDAYVTTAGCRPIGSPCPDEPWPEEEEIRRRAPGFDGPIVYVAPSATGESPAGSRDNPHVDINEALVVAGEGGIVALSSGLHEVAAVVRERTALVGACATQTILTLGASAPPAPVVEVRGRGGLVTHASFDARRAAISFRARGAARAVVVDNAGDDAFTAVGDGVDVVLEDIVVRRSEGSALFVTSGASVTMTHAHLAAFALQGVVVDDRADLVGSDLLFRCRPAAADEGIAMSVSGRASATLTAVATEECAGVAIYAEGAGTKVSLEDAWIEDATPRSVNTFGIGVTGAAELRADRTTFTGLAIGIAADEGAIVTVQDALFHQGDGTASLNPHVMSLGGSTLDLQRAVLRGGDAGVWSEGDGRLRDVVFLGQRIDVDDVNPGATGTAVWVSTGTLNAERIVIAEPDTAGLLAVEEVDAVTFRDLWVDGASKGGIDIGMGEQAMFSIGLGDAGDVAAERVLATDVTGLALMMQLCDVASVRDFVSVARAEPSPSQPDGAVQIARTSDVTIERLRTEVPRSVGLHLSRVARASVIDVDVLRPRARALDGAFGRGVQIDETFATLNRCRVDGADDAGVYLTTSTATISDLVVDGTRGAPCSPIPSPCVEAGHGLVVTDQSGLSLSDFAISGSHAAGIVLAGSATLSANGGVIADNLIGVSAAGSGIDLDASFQRVRLRDNVVDVSADEVPVPVAIVPVELGASAP